MSPGSLLVPAVVTAVTPAPVSAPDPAGTVAGAWTLFAVVALLLLLFVLFVATVTLLRRRRAADPGATKRGGERPIDPWREAGRRLRP